MYQLIKKNTTIICRQVSLCWKTAFLVFSFASFIGCSETSSYSINSKPIAAFTVYATGLEPTLHINEIAIEDTKYIKSFRILEPNKGPSKVIITFDGFKHLSLERSNFPVDNFDGPFSRVWYASNDVALRYELLNMNGNIRNYFGYIYKRIDDPLKLAMDPDYSEVKEYINSRREYRGADSSIFKQAMLIIVNRNHEFSYFVYQYEK